MSPTPPRIEPPAESGPVLITSTRALLPPDQQAKRTKFSGGDRDQRGRWAGGTEGESGQQQKGMGTPWWQTARPGIPREYQNLCGKAFARKTGVGFHQVRGDYQAYHTFFANRTRPGVYVEIGAYHPTELSAGAFFDICLGWHGVCVEPDPTKAQVWDADTSRSCNVFKQCLLDHDETVCMGKLNDGITEVIGGKKGKCGPTEAEVNCTTFEAMLESTVAKSRLGSTKSLKSNEKTRIDFVSLDVETKEIDVLRCFPFEKYDISMFLIETASNENLYDWFMLNKGYLKWDDFRNGPYPTDTLYVKRSMLHDVYVDPVLEIPTLYKHFGPGKTTTLILTQKTEP
uniref:Methyltransferase FkbM domain-containing protein n=1 Tax=Lotharella globosa TaxID=91324 RepID=A0A7S4DQK9_9EUKA